MQLIIFLTGISIFIEVPRIREMEWKISTLGRESRPLGFIYTPIGPIILLPAAIFTKMLYIIHPCHQKIGLILSPVDFPPYGNYNGIIDKSTRAVSLCNGVLDICCPSYTGNPRFILITL
jgi:hypothetical protein